MGAGQTVGAAIRYFTDKSGSNREEYGHLDPPEHSNGLHGGHDARTRPGCRDRSGRHAGRLSLSTRAFNAGGRRQRSQFCFARLSTTGDQADTAAKLKVGP
jgi:hypothetical protein